ncbi:MAG: HAD-IA family hydrolase [Verrucomicrobiales bacterium]|nr:HAD-IA family hydrolase [Verrucomicrobiales bacterium]
MNRPKPLTHPIQAVTFDVGGTLVVPHPSVGEVYHRIAVGHGVTGTSPELLDQRFQKAWHAARSSPQRREEWESLVDAVFEGLSPTPPSQTFFAELYEEFGRARAWRVLPEVIPTLEALAGQGVDLGIVSNWDERLRPLLGELRLDRYFSCFAISCETGFAKPSPVIFQEALRQLGCPAATVLHVGDALREDFAGAMSAGLAALHLRRDATSRDLQIRSLEEVVEWVARSGTGRPEGRAQKFLTPDG